MAGNRSKDDTLLPPGPGMVSILRSFLNCSGDRETETAREDGFSRTASVKFMITLQDGRDLLALGYCRSQIEKMKPQEAAEILLSGKKSPC